MSATEVVYLYGYGRRKHIASGALGRGGGSPAYCGNWFRDEVATLEDFRRWLGPQQAEQRMAKQRAFPVCKACEKAAPPADTPPDPADIEGAARQLVRASGALLCDYSGERGVWWDGFRDALLKTRQALGLTDDLTDTDLEARS